MSNEFVPDCLVHKDSRNIQTRLDYMLLFRNETKAKIIRIMETWTNQRRAEWHKRYIQSKEQGGDLPEEPPEGALWVTMSYQEFSIYAYGTMNHDNIKENVDALVESGYLQRRPHLEFPYGSPQYLLDTNLLQGILNDQEIPSLFEDIGKIKPPRKKHTPLVKYPQGRGINTPRDGVNLPPGWGENTPPSKNISKNYLESTNNKEREGADAPTRAEISQLEEKVVDYQQEVKRITDKHKAVSSCSQGLSENDEDISLAETAHRMPAVQKPGAHSLPLVATPLSGGQGDTSVQAQILTSEPAPSQDGATPVANPSIGSGPRASGRRNPVPARPPQLTLEGVQAREWYEEIRDVKVRMTAGNVQDLNDLGECEGLSKLSLLTMIEHLENKKWVKDNQVAISLHMLSGNDARFAFLSFEENWPLIKRKLNGKKPQSRPMLDEVDCIDERWCVYKRPGDDQEWILWQGELCTPEEADERGYAGGGGLYIQTQYAK